VGPIRIRCRAPCCGDQKHNQRDGEYSVADSKTQSGTPHRGLLNECVPGIVQPSTASESQPMLAVPSFTCA